MKKIKFYFVLCVLIFICGCANKNQNAIDVKNELLAYTQKFQDDKNGEKVFAVATYINPVFADKQSKNIENFIVAIYPKYELKDVNINKQIVKVNKISYSEFQKYSPISFPWANHFKIKFNNINNEKQFKLTFKMNGSNVELNFSKFSQSMYWTSHQEFDDK